MATVVTSATPYCTPTQLLTRLDWRIVADALREDDDQPRPLKATILDDASEPGAMLAQLCLDASGELESACLAKMIYSVTDLQALTGSTAGYLQAVVAGLIVRLLFGRKAPITGKAEDIPVYRTAANAMKLLGDGVNIFGLVNQRDAGGGDTVISRLDSTLDNANSTVNQARGYFGVRGTGGRNYGC